MSKSYIAILVVLLMAAVLGMAVAEDPGYLLIAWRNLSIETSVWVGVAFIVGHWLLVALLRSVFRLLSASGRRINPWSRQNRHRRAGVVTTRGLLEFAEGHWANSLRLLKRSAPHAEQPLINDGRRRRGRPPPRSRRRSPTPARCRRTPRSSR